MTTRVRRIAGAAALVGVGVAVAAVLLQRRRLRWITKLTNIIPAHHDYWRERGKTGDLLYVAVGDSAALGIGATTPAGGYVGIVADEIARRTGRTVRVRNLGIDGARLETCITDELPRLATLRPDICTLCIGANDMWTFEPARFQRELDTILDAMPPGAIVAEVPDFSVLPVRRQVDEANRILRRAVAARGLTLAPLHSTTGKGGLLAAIRGSAGDLFHPNDRGYHRWAAAFLPAIRSAADALGTSATERTAAITPTPRSAEPGPGRADALG